MSFLSDLFGTSGSENALTQIAQQQQQIAGQEQGVGTQLQQPLLTGQLPAPAQALVDQILRSNMAGLGNTFAKLGLTGSTMQAGAQNEARQASLGQTFGIEEDLFKLGQQAIAEALGGLSGASSSYMDVANLNLQTDKILADTIGSFAKALGGGAAMGGFSMDIPGIGPANVAPGESSQGMGGWT